MSEPTEVIPQPKELKFTTQTTTRSEVLIASFVDGYAAGWAFALPEAFKEALDIRFTEKTIMALQKKYMVWTQGNFFAFSESDTIHNSRLAYDNWDEYLRGTNPVTLQVLEATPSSIIHRETYRATGEIPFPVQVEVRSRTKEVDASIFEVRKMVYERGKVKVAIMKPNADKSSMEVVTTVTMTQDKLIAVLQSGIWREITETSYAKHDFRYHSEVQK